MSWSTVEWPPKNNRKLKSQATPRPRVARILWALLLFTTVLAAGFALGQTDWQQAIDTIQQKLVPVYQYFTQIQIINAGNPK